MSSIATYSPPLERVFSEPEASVMNTLSALHTYIAAEVLLLMVTFSSTSCIFAVSSAFTIIIPSSNVPERMYVPSSVIVAVEPLIVTESELLVMLSPLRVSLTLVLSP